MKVSDRPSGTLDRSVEILSPKRTTGGTTGERLDSRKPVCPRLLPGKKEREGIVEIFINHFNCVLKYFTNFG